MPLIVMALVGYILFAAIATKIGMQQVVDNQIRMDPKAEARLAQLTPEQKIRTEVLKAVEELFVSGCQADCYCIDHAKWAVKA